MPLDVKDIKLLRAKQQRNQNIKNEQESLINELAATYTLVAPSIANYTELKKWVIEQHKRLSEVKASRENSMQDNNRRIEKISEDIRVNITQALEHVENDRRKIESEHTSRLGDEKSIYDSESNRIKEKHAYLISSNSEILKEATEKLESVSYKLTAHKEQLQTIIDTINSYTTRNKQRRDHVIAMIKAQKQAKKDKQATIVRLQEACRKEEYVMQDIQQNIDMYKDSRRRINAEYYEWLSEIAYIKDEILGLTNTRTVNSDSTASISTVSKTCETDNELANLKSKLFKLQNDDIRRLPDNRYYKLDQDVQRWMKDIEIHKRQMSRLRSELSQARSISPDKINVDSNGNSDGGMDLELEAKLDKEYQYLKLQRKQLTQTITTLEHEVARLDDEVKQAQHILTEETDGMGKELQKQWDRCDNRWNVMKSRIDNWLADKLAKLTVQIDSIKAKHTILLNERAVLEHENTRKCESDSECHLNNARIMAALQCLNKLQKLL